MLLMGQSVTYMTKLTESYTKAILTEEMKNRVKIKQNKEYQRKWHLSYRENELKQEQTSNKHHIAKGVV